MIDFHTHILPEIDDGSYGINETIEILKEAKEARFTKIISTSHYIEDYYEYTDNERKELLQQIRNNYNEVELFLGSEIYMTENMIQLIENKQASTINDSKYVLFELPMNSKTMTAKEMVYRLIENGYIPIIAHPERYSYVQQRPEYVQELNEMGALFQANYGSIIGLYGHKAEKTLKILLKKDLIHFMGSDVHCARHIYPKISKAIKKIRKIVSEEKIEEITYKNAQKVLENNLLN